MSDFTISLEQQDSLLDLFSEEELQAKREANKDNEAIVKAIDTRLEAQAEAQRKAEALEAMTTSLNSLELPSANDMSSCGILNIYRPIIKDSRTLTKAEVKEVLSANPSLTEEEVSTRRKELDGYVYGSWVINKAFTSTKATGTISTRQRKLAITLNKREGDKLVPIGNFRTSKEACVYLSLDTKGDSARRVLEAHKYVVDDYDGDTFLVSES